MGKNLKILIKFVKIAIIEIDLATVRLSTKRKGIINNIDNIPKKSRQLYMSLKYDRGPL